MSYNKNNNSQNVNFICTFAPSKSDLNMLNNVSILSSLVLYKNLNRLLKMNLSTFVVVFLLSIGVNAQVIYENPITGSNPNTSNPYIIGQVNNSNLSVSGIGRGSGITGSNGNNRYSANNWTMVSNSDNNDYFYWTITPNSCNEIDFSSLVLTFERSASGPQNFALRSSIDNYATDIWTFNYNTTALQSQSINLGASSFQNLTAGVTFRIYGWSSTAGTGTFSINSFAFNGLVNTTPTPVSGSISGESVVCYDTGTTLTLSGSVGNIQWQSSTNNSVFTDISSANSSVFVTGSLTEPKYYRAVLSSYSCPSATTSSFLVGITESILVGVGATACGPASVNLSVTNACTNTNSITTWFSAAAGGVALGTGSNFTTPVLSSTTTYYAANSFIGGNTTIGNDESQQEDIGLVFDVTSTMLLNSLQVEASHNGSITVQLFDISGNAIAGFPQIVFPISAGINTLNFGWTIPAGVGYQLQVTNISNGGELMLTENYTWPAPLGTLGSVTGAAGSGNQYNYFYNWNISPPRIPVTATIIPNTNNTTTISACNSYTWSVNGTTYTTSGTYTSVSGCHTETLVLSITPGTNNTTTVSTCDTYTWSVNGTTYTTSGTYTSVTGCHTETLVLTITPSTSNTTTSSACDTYTWSVNGTTYTTSGTYTSVTGCHTETLVLTITPSSNNTTTASACDTYTWSVNGITYTTSGTYTSVTGCHTETLVLTVNTSSVYYVDADVDGFGSTIAGNFCAMPSTGYSLNNTDCNDAVATIYPGATELCNSVDDNCNGFIDEGCPSTIPGEEPFNAFSAPSTYYSYCNSFYGTLAGAFPSDLAQSACETGEDVWYSFTALTTGITIFIGSNANDIVIELQDVNGNLIEIENAVNGVGTEVLSTNALIPGVDYIFGVRNKNSNIHPGGQYSACIRHLRRGGSDSGTSATWPGTLSTCALFKAIYCGGTGVQYRFTWTGISGSANGQVFSRTQTSDYLNVTAVTPSLHAGCTYDVLVTAIYSIPNGTGAIEVFELTANAPTAITILPAADVALRGIDQMSNGPRYRGSVVAAMPWVCGVTNWRWRFTEVNSLTLETVGLPIEQNRGAASNFINLNNVAALQYGKTYAVQSAPIFSYTGVNYQWGPVKYMSIIGSAGLIVDPTEVAAQGSEKDALQGPSEGATQEMELSVFPNPSNGSDLNLSISGIESENVQVNVYDALGRKIESKRIVIDGTLQTTLNLANELTNGLYILEVTTEDVKRSVRFMVEQ